jgi:hypothetical protein
VASKALNVLRVVESAAPTLLSTLDKLRKSRTKGGQAGDRNRTS